MSQIKWISSKQSFCAKSPFVTIPPLYLNRENLLKISTVFDWLMKPRIRAIFKRCETLLVKSLRKFFFCLNEHLVISVSKAPQHTVCCAWGSCVHQSIRGSWNVFVVLMKSAISPCCNSLRFNQCALRCCKASAESKLVKPNTDTTGSTVVSL